MLIQSIEGDVEDNMDFDNLCLICYDTLEDGINKVVTLQCNHKYHYDCILATYKSLNGKKQCPYCRSNGSYLSLPPGKLPIKNIHQEYNKEGNYNIQYIEGKCKYILKRGKNSGSQCTFNIKTEGGLCSRHHKLLQKKNMPIEETVII